MIHPHTPTAGEYSNQNKWSDSDNVLDIFTGYAKDIGLKNLDKFKKDVQNKTYDAKIKSDQSDGTTLGVNATPTFYINSQQLVGVIQYDDFKSKIDDVLKNNK